MNTNTANNKWLLAACCMSLIAVASNANAQMSDHGTSMGQSSSMGNNSATGQTHAMQAPNESSGGYMDNSAITMKVKAMLMKDESLKSLDIHVTTKNEVVTLAGTVKNMHESERAVRIAKSVDGVKAVKNNMKQEIKK